ncbi:WSC-domain-containing protein [Ramaria rubella]|nr:WSC-domain-containing protein [Ramaria rubella]
MLCLTVTLIIIIAFVSLTNASPSTVVSRQTVVTDLPGNWAFLGCFEETVNSRVLNGATFTNSTEMTIEACVDFCNSQSFVYAGLEFGEQCFCDDVFEGAATIVDNSECNEACPGNPDQLCGAPSRLSVYTSGVPAVFPTQVPSVGQWVAAGCITDSVDTRTLSTNIPFNFVTVGLCTSACLSAGFIFAGLEFGQECWCGSEINGVAVFVSDSDGISGSPPVRSTSDGPLCSMACSGNPNELCGGSDRMDLYNLTTNVLSIPSSVGDFVTLGCFSIFNRLKDGLTLNNLINDPPGVNIETCTSTCMLESSWKLAGLSIGVECFCDTIEALELFPPPVDNDNCDFSCSFGNSSQRSESCGGSNFLLILELEGVSPVLDAFSSITSSIQEFVAVINSVDASNFPTVGPNIGPALQALSMSVSAAAGSADNAVNNGSIPLTGDFASQAMNAFFAVPFDSVFTALVSQSSLLIANFSSPILAGIQSFMSEGVDLAQTMSSDITPSFGSTPLSVQTDIEQNAAIAAAAYQS